MIAAEGVLTSRGGRTSHAAVVARGMGKTCVCGAEALDVDVKAGKVTGPRGVVIVEGDLLSIDGATGEVFLGEVPVVPTNAGGIPEVVTGGVEGLLVAPRDPERMTEAHRTDGLAELVCSNSFRSDDAANTRSRACALAPCCPVLSLCYRPRNAFCEFRPTSPT